MKKFPKRTRESDSKALLVVQALGRSANAGKNYMVTVVTTDIGRCFISLSGSTRSVVENELRCSLHWIGQLNTTGKAMRPLKKSLAKLEKKVGGDYFAGAHKSATAFHPLHDKLVDPKKETVIERRGAIPPIENPLEFIGLRDCAEPKALHDAASAGAKITGMTTVWYGGVNIYPDTSGPINGILGEYALPCPFCNQNEARIMMEVDRAYWAHKGLSPTSYEV